MYLYIKRINNNDFHPLGKNETKFQIALGDGLSKTVLLFPLFSQVWTAVPLRTWNASNVVIFLRRDTVVPVRVGIDLLTTNRIVLVN